MKEDAGEEKMLNKIGVSEAFKAFYEIINKVSSEKQNYMLTSDGKPVAVILSVKEFELLKEIEDRIDIEDAWKVKEEETETVGWEDVKKELGL